MDTERLLALARRLIDEVTFCLAATPAENGDISARVVQPRPLSEAWTGNVLTNRLCRKVR